MDELEIQGQKYISSKRAAKLTGYAPDYVGQLARGGKVDATRVGRSWYVSESSILKHVGGENSEETKENSIASTLIPSPVSYEKTISLSSLRGERPTDFKTWGTVQYHSDDFDLFPKMEVNNDDEKPTEEKTPEIIDIPVRKLNFHRQSTSLSEIKTIDGVVRSPDQEPTTPLPQTESLLQVSHQKRVQPWLFVGASGAVALILTLAILGSATISSEWTPQRYVSSASSADFAPIWAYLETIVRTGFALLVWFIDTTVSAFMPLVQQGVDFLRNLVNLG